MIVCVCHRVNDQTIVRAARNGMAFDDIQLEYGVATQCGKCECSAGPAVVRVPCQPVARITDCP